jgi:uncharacterized Tic20 family protein
MLFFTKRFVLLLYFQGMNKIIYLHLSTLLGAIFPFGGIIFPYICWRVQAQSGDEDDGIDIQKY